MSDSYYTGTVTGGPNSSGGVPAAPAPSGGSITDLVSTNKGGVTNLANLYQTVSNSLPPITASSSPVVTGINSLGTTAVSVVASRIGRNGIVFHNPATTSVNVYVFPSIATPAPTLSAPGGSFIVFPGETFAFPSIAFANMNTAFSAFAGTGTNNALTILEFL